jgi:glycosyltransferase involved in cell wall biosynthesis
MNKVLAFCDGACVTTGFGRVAKEILTGLHYSGDVDLVQLGINYYGEPTGMPFHIWPMNPGDPFGRAKFPKVLNDTQPDLLFTINDIWAQEWIVPILNQYRQRSGKRVPWVSYIPIDGTPLNARHVQFMKEHIDVPIMYSRWASDLVKEIDPTLDLEYVYHGVDLETFNYDDKDNIQKQFLEQVSEQIGREVNFIIGYVGRNQPRKRLPELFMAYKHFAKDRDDVLLYLHTATPDMGWNLHNLRAMLGISKDDIAISPDLHPARGIPDQHLSFLYKAFDVIALPTIGEGFGLPIVEGMASGAIPVTTNFGVSKEIVEGHGFLINIGNYTVMPNDHEFLRPIPSTVDMSDIFSSIYNTKRNNPEQYRELQKKASERAKDFGSWHQDRWVAIVKEQLDIANSTTEPLDFIFEEETE